MVVLNGGGAVSYERCTPVKGVEGGVGGGGGSPDRVGPCRPRGSGSALAPASQSTLSVAPGKGGGIRDAVLGLRTPLHRTHGGGGAKAEQRKTFSGHWPGSQGRHCFMCATFAREQERGKSALAPVLRSTLPTAPAAGSWFGVSVDEGVAPHHRHHASGGVS